VFDLTLAVSWVIGFVWKLVAEVARLPKFSRNSGEFRYGETVTAPFLPPRVNYFAA
jgi:hypothetical protein